VNLRRLIRRRIRGPSGGVDLVGDLNVVADVNVGGRHRVASAQTDRRSAPAEEPDRTRKKGAG